MLSLSHTHPYTGLFYSRSGTRLNELAESHLFRCIWDDECSQGPGYWLIPGASVRPNLINEIRRICISRLHSFYLSLSVTLISWPRVLAKRLDWKLFFMTSGQFPFSFSLPPFSCLVTPAVWVSRPPWLSSRDFGPRCRSFSDFRLSLWVQLGGRVTVSVCVFSSVCVCAYVYDFALDALNQWESLSGSLNVRVCSHYAIMWVCGQFHSLCLR